MGIPDMESPAIPPVRKRPRLSLKASRQKAESTPPHENFSNNATATSTTPTSSSSSSETVTSSESETSVSSAGTSDRDTRVPAVASLENFGNTCFMNSVLQVLRYTPGFLDSLAHLFHDITASEKIIRKKKANEEEPLTPTFEEENSKKCWKVVKSVYKVYRDQTQLEDKYEEVASDDVMSMSVKPSKVLNSVRELNPMFEGNYQHDAQEFLRCLLCYLQDAEKETQKFYFQLPPRFSPQALALNPIMQKFLQATKWDGSSNANTGAKTAAKVDAGKAGSEKVKHNLFPKPAVKTETAKSPSKLIAMPQLGDTASVVADEQSISCHPTGAMSTPQASLTADLPDGFKVDIGDVATVVSSASKPPARSRATARRGRKFHPYQGAAVGNRTPDSLAVKAKENGEHVKRDKIGNNYQPSITQMLKTYSNKKRLGMRGPVVSKSAEELFDEIQNPSEKEHEAMIFENISNSSENCASGVRTGSETKLSESVAMSGNESAQYSEIKDDGTYLTPDKKVIKGSVVNIDNKATASVQNDIPASVSSNYDAKDCLSPNQITRSSFQDMFANFLQNSTPSDSDGSVTMNSDSDNEDIVTQKRIAKDLHESPRRSPRKMTSSPALASPRKLDFNSKFTLTSSSDTILTLSRKGKMSIEQTKTGSPKKSISSNALDVPPSNPITTLTSGISSVSVDTDVEGSPVDSVGLLPVVKLEKCDHVFDSDATSVDATYATQCLTPCKQSPDKGTMSSNYLKQRSVLARLAVSSEAELQCALDEMYNSPVKSLSRCDLIERLFQGTMMLRTRCLQCESSKERKEDFHDVSVPVRLEAGDSDDEDEGEMKSGLMKLIEASTEVERLLEENKYYCDTCQIYAEAERSVHYDTLPDILTLHLKRFSADIGGGSISKINDPVDIPLTLPCLRYRCPKLCMRPDHRYTLYAVVTHSGVTLSSGHYLAYVRTLSKKPKVVTLPTTDKKPVQSTMKPSPGETTGTNKSNKKLPTTRRKAGISPKLPARFKENIVADTKVKAFANVSNNARKPKMNIAEALAPSKRFTDGEWFECDDETVRLFDEQDFVDLLSGKEGALLGTPYLLFYHKATLC